MRDGKLQHYRQRDAADCGAACPRTVAASFRPKCVVQKRRLSRVSLRVIEKGYVRNTLGGNAIRMRREANEHAILPASEVAIVFPIDNLARKDVGRTVRAPGKRYV